jgi:hypothetical protein
VSTLASSILVVRQGRALGRAPRAGDATLGWIRRNDPLLAARILVHETGTGALPAVAAGAGAVVFWLPTGLRDRFPVCYREASAIGELAARRGAVVVNPAAALSAAAPVTRAGVWAGAGLRCAPPRSYRNRTELEALLRVQPAPLVVRPEWTHTAQFARTRADAIGVALAGWQCAGSVMPFVDTRDAGHRDDPESVWARLHHRMRAYVCGDTVLPAEVLFSESPVVRPENSTFQRYAGWRSLLQLMACARRVEREAIAADRAFARAEPAEAETLRHAVGVLGLRFAAVDYSTDPDGVPTLWSVDPCPDLLGWSSMGMPLLRRTAPRLTRFFECSAGFLRGLIPDAIDRRRTA